MRIKMETFSVESSDVELAIHAACEASYIHIGDASIQIELIYDKPNPESLFQRKEYIEKLSNDAKEVLGVIFFDRSELCKLFYLEHKKANQSTLRTHLRKYRKWKHVKIDKVFKEIRNMLKTLPK